MTEKFRWKKYFEYMHFMTFFLKIDQRNEIKFCERDNMLPSHLRVCHAKIKRKSAADNANISNLSAHEATRKFTHQTKITKRSEDEKRAVWNLFNFQVFMLEFALAYA
jgi:hypothetical protein